MGGGAKITVDVDAQVKTVKTYVGKYSLYLWHLRASLRRDTKKSNTHTGRAKKVTPRKNLISLEL